MKRLLYMAAGLVAGVIAGTLGYVLVAMAAQALT